MTSRISSKRLKPAYPCKSLKAASEVHGGEQHHNPIYKHPASTSQYPTAPGRRLAFAPQSIIGWSSTSKADSSKAVRSARVLEHLRCPTLSHGSTHDQALSLDTLLATCRLALSGIVCIGVESAIKSNIEARSGKRDKTHSSPWRLRQQRAS